MNPLLIAHGLMVDEMAVSAVKTATFTARHNMIYPVDTTTGAFSISAPASPVPGLRFSVYDHAKRFDTAPLTVLRNGALILDVADDYLIDTKSAFRTFLYISDVKGWIVR